MSVLFDSCSTEILKMSLHNFNSMVQGWSINVTTVIASFLYYLWHWHVSIFAQCAISSVFLFSVLDHWVCFLRPQYYSVGSIAVSTDFLSGDQSFLVHICLTPQLFYYLYWPVHGDISRRWLMVCVCTGIQWIAAVEFVCKKIISNNSIRYR